MVLSNGVVKWRWQMALSNGIVMRHWQSTKFQSNQLKNTKVLQSFIFRWPVGWLSGKPVWPFSILKYLWIKNICWVLPSFNQIDLKMPQLCTFSTFSSRLVCWLGGRLVWLVSILQSLQIKFICWVLPFKDYIPFNQIGWKMPKLCTFSLLDW